MNEGRLFLPFSIWYAAVKTSMFPRGKKQNEIESEKNSCDEAGTVRPTDWRATIG